MENGEKVYKRRRLERWCRIFGVFLAFLWLCTIISKSIYASGLARVSVQTPEKKYIEHIVEAEGIVTAGGLLAVNTAPGLRVLRVRVSEGDLVEAGDVLFTVDLEDLAALLSEKEAELAKRQYRLADVQFNEVLDVQKREVALLWAQEDYESADAETATNVRRAQEALQKAQHELDEHLARPAPYTPDGDRRIAWDAYNDWKEACYELTDRIAAKEREIREMEEDLAELAQSGGAPSQEAGKDGQDGDADAAGTDKEGASGGAGAGEDAGGSFADGGAPSQEAGKDGQDGDADATGTDEEDASGGQDTDAAEDETAEGRDKDKEDAAALRKAQLRAAIRKAQGELSALQDALRAQEREAVKEPDYAAEENAYDMWQKTKSALEDAVEEAKRTLEDEDFLRHITLRQKAREIAGAAAGGAADSTASIYGLEIAALQGEIARLNAVKGQGGQIKAESGGFVSGIRIEAGGRTTDTAAMLLTDAEASCQFRFTITKEQGRYLHLGDAFTLKIDGAQEMEGRVDYLTQNTAGGYDIACRLPEGVGRPGAAGRIRKSVQGELQNLTVPVDALHEETQAYYVYTYNERAAILGDEAYAEKVRVQIADRNDRYAALESGAVGSGTQIITFSSEELEQGEIVRLEGR